MPQVLLAIFTTLTEKMQVRHDRHVIVDLQKLNGWFHWIPLVRLLLVKKWSPALS